MMLKTISLASLATLALTGCNPSDDSGTTDEPGGPIDHVDLAGHWKILGTDIAYNVVIDNNKRFMANNGSEFFVGTSANSIYKSASFVLANGIVCDLVNNACQDFSLSLSADSADSLSGTYLTAYRTDQVTLQKVESLNTEVTFSDIENKTWVDATNPLQTAIIYSDGSLTGTDADGTAFTGSATDTGLNAFSYSIVTDVDGDTATIPGLFYLDAGGRLISGGAILAGNQFQYYISPGIFNIE